MSAVRFNSIFPTERGEEITLEIWDTAYSGAATSFNTKDNGYNLKYSANGFEEAAQFMATECEFVFWIENATHEALITDFVTAQEGRFLVRILKDSVLEWTGLILFDSTSYEEVDYPFAFQIKAVDGIGTLKDVDFKDISGPYTGKSKMIEYLTRALSKISYVSEFYGAGDVFLRTSVDWWEETMTHSPTGVDMLDQAYLSNAVYYEYKNGVLEYKSCYDVIKDILTALECRITYAKGAFWIEQISYRIATTIIQRQWETDGTFISAVNYSIDNDIDQTASGALLATGIYEFTAPLSEARHEFKALERRNFFAGAENVDDTHTGIDTFYTPIHGNSGETTLRITGGMVLRISSNTFAPGYTNPLEPFVAVIRLNIFLDNYGLQNSYTLQASYQVAFTPVIWHATPGLYVCQTISGPFLANTTDDIFTFTQGIDLITPPLPENTESFTFSCELETLKKSDGTTYSFADFDITYEISNLWMEAYSEGGPVLSGEAAKYSTLNTDTQNTKVYKSESLIGSSTNVNTVGAIWVKPASTYILAGLWGIGATTPAYSFIGQMLTYVVASTRAKTSKKLNGSLYGDIASLALVVWDSINWVLMGGTWDAVHNIFTGEWIEIRHTAGLTPSTPIRYIATDHPNPPRGNTSTTGGLGPFRVGAPLGTIMYPVASTLSEENIRAGVITSLPIQDTLTDYDFNTGDTIVIVDPFTGGFEELLVTALTTTGQTAISVSGTLLNDYPRGAPIVRLPRIGAGFSLPSGPDGAILRRTSGSWAPYGTTALSDGVVLTWTDAGGWAAAALPAGYTDEQAQDAVGSMLSDSTEIDFTYTDATPSLTAVLKTTGVSAGTYNSLTVDIKGRVTAATLIAYLTANQSITLSGDVTGSGTTAITTTIANAVVTFAKFQNLSALSVFARSGNTSGVGAALAASAANQYLRVNSAGTSLEWGTITAVTGTGAAGQVALFTGASTVGGSATFTYDSTNKRLQVSEQVTPGAKVGTYNADYGTITGSREWMNIDGSLSTNLTATIRNFRNVGGTGDNIFSLVTGGANGGDPMLQFIISGVETWSIGVDNSDADKLKIKPQASPGAGATGGEGITITTAVTPLVGINTDTPIHPMDVNGLGRALTWTNGTDATGGTGGTSTFSTGAGGSPSLTALVCPNGNMMTVRFTSGSSPTAGARIINIVPPAAVRHASKIYVILGGYNDVTQRDIAKFVIDTSATTPANIAIKSNSLLSGIDAATDYFLCIHIMGHA